MYVLNRCANYPNGNQEAWPLQLAGLFPFHFSCNTSQSLVMKHSVLWRLRVGRSAAGKWMFLSPQTDLTEQQDDVTGNTSAPEASNYSASCLQMRRSSTYLRRVGAGVIGINTVWMTRCIHGALPEWKWSQSGGSFTLWCGEISVVRVCVRAIARLEDRVREHKAMHTGARSRACTHLSFL